MTKSYQNFEICLKIILGNEGGYSNNKYDKGGATNYGITQGVYDVYRKENGLPPKDVKYITQQEVKDIYYSGYWKTSGADKIADPKMALVVFDTAVNMGPSVAKKIYEQSGGDVNKYLDIRKQRYLDIVKNDPSQKIFLQGWLNRLDELRQYIKQHPQGNIAKNQPMTYVFAPNITTSGCELRLEGGGDEPSTVTPLIASIQESADAHEVAAVVEKHAQMFFAMVEEAQQRA